MLPDYTSNAICNKSIEAGADLSLLAKLPLLSTTVTFPVTEHQTILVSDRGTFVNNLVEWLGVEPTISRS